jgi:hypothetical protein
MTQRNDKAILINARENTVSYVTIGEYTDIQKFGNYDLFTTVGLGGGETLYVDDEGLLNGTNVGFTIEDYAQPLMGNGVILGSNPHTGDSKDTAFTIEEIAKKVKCFVRFGNGIIKAPSNPEVVQA